MRGILFGAMLVISATGQVAFSKPNETAQFLMNEPASMMDIGLMRAEKWLDDMQNKENPVTWANFSWEENQIYLGAMFSGTKGHNEETCANWFKEVRYRAGVKEDGGLVMGGHSFFAERFGHSGYRSAKEPLDHYESVDRLVKLYCTVSHDADAAERYNAPLVGTGYSVIRP